MRPVLTSLIAMLFIAGALLAAERWTLESGTIINLVELHKGMVDPGAITVDDVGAVWTVDRMTGSVWRMHYGQPARLIRTFPVYVGERPDDRELLSGVEVLRIGSRHDVFLLRTLVDQRLVVQRYALEDDTLVGGETIFTVHGVPFNGGHFIRRLIDGTLLVGVGSFDYEVLHDTESLNGKILRITREGHAPSDNPLYAKNQPNHPRNFIYAFGTRHSAGCTQIPFTHPTLGGVVYSVEPGEFGSDEINRLVPGADHGARRVSGYCNDASSTYVCPKATMREVPSSIAYYGSNAIPEWTGSFLIGTLRKKGLVIADVDGDGNIVNIDGSQPPDNVLIIDREHALTFETGERVRSVAVDELGRVFLSLTTFSASGPNGGRVVMLVNPSAPIKVSEDNRGMQFRVSPNPFTDMISVHLGSPSTGTEAITLMDLFGRTITKLIPEAGHHHIMLDGGMVASGAYMLRIEKNGLSHSELVVRQ